MHTCRYYGATLAVLVVTALAEPVLAQTDPALIAARRTLIERAQQASASGNHAQALDLANRAWQIQQSTSLRAFIAGEQRETGRLAQALGNAELCVRGAQAETQLANRAQIQRTCSEMVTVLRARVGYVTVRPQSPIPPGLQVTVSGAALNEAFYGAPYIVSPGNVVVEAHAPGMLPYHQEVQVPPQGSIDMPFSLERDPNAATATTTTTATTASGQSAGTSTATPPTATTTTTATPTTTSQSGTTTATQAASPVQPVRESGQSGQSIVGPVVVMGAGGALLVTSLTFFLLHSSAVNNLKEVCPLRSDNSSYDCPNQAMGTLNRAEAFGTVSLVTLGLGVVAAAGGTAWLLFGRGNSSHPQARLDLQPTPGGALLGIGGTL